MRRLKKVTDSLFRQARHGQFDQLPWRKRCLSPFLACLLLFTSMAAAEVPPFAERARRAIEPYAHPQGGRDAGYATIAAKLYLHEDGAWCSDRLR